MKAHPRFVPAFRQCIWYVLRFGKNAVLQPFSASAKQGNSLTVESAVNPSIEEMVNAQSIDQPDNFSVNQIICGDKMTDDGRQIKKTSDIGPTAG